MTQCKAPVESDLCSCHCPYGAGPPWTSMPPSLTQRRAHWEKQRGDCGTPAVDLRSAGNPSRQTTWFGCSRFFCLRLLEMERLGCATFSPPTQNCAGTHCRWEPTSFVVLQMACCAMHHLLHLVTGQLCSSYPGCYCGLFQIQQ